MQARELLIAIVAVIITLVVGGTVLVLASLLGRRRSSPAAARNPSAAAALPADDWLVAKNNQQFGPITFDQLRSYARDGLVSRSDLLKKAGSPAWLRAQDIHGLFPLQPPLPAEPAVRRPIEIALSAHDRVAAPPVSEAQALRHVTADLLRGAGGNFGLDRSAPPARAQPPISGADRKRSN